MSYYYRFSNPIKTDQGIKAKSKRGTFVQNWWAMRWINTLEKLVDVGRLQRGRRYARGGQVLSLEEKRGQILARVQGSYSTPYRVTIKIEKLSDTTWEHVIHQLAGRTVFMAQLLVGEMPMEIEDIFQSAGTYLFPAHSGELLTECSCPDGANPCKHIAAVHYILGEQFDEDPFLIFRLRGRTQEQILDALQIHTEPEEEDFPQDTVVPLEETIDNFWEMDQSLADFQTHIQPPATEFPILKRLGQPKFLEEDLIELLGPAYQIFTEQTMKMAFDNDKE